MSEEKKEMTKPEKKRVPTFGDPDAFKAEKPIPKTPETSPEEYPLFQKLDKIIELLQEKENGITHQLCRVADAIENKTPRVVESIAPLKTQVSPEVAKTIPPPPRQAPAPQPTGKQVEDIRMMFTQDLEGLLIFEDKGDYIRIAPRQYLGSDNFAKIASIIRETGGQYVSDKKNSHFRIPK